MSAREKRPDYRGSFEEQYRAALARYRRIEEVRRQVDEREREIEAARVNENFQEGLRTAAILRDRINFGY